MEGDLGSLAFLPSSVLDGFDVLPPYSPQHGSVGDVVQWELGLVYPGINSVVYDPGTVESVTSTCTNEIQELDVVRNKTFKNTIRKQFRNHCRENFHAWIERSNSPETFQLDLRISALKA